MDALIMPFMGGILIGLSALVLMWANGRIAGISGISGGALDSLFSELSGTAFAWAEAAWRWAFLVGLLGGAWLAVYFGWSSGELVLPAAMANTVLLVIAGLLVGFGTRLGSGCTSGHGVCGLGRQSRRSLVATVTFMAVGALTVFITAGVSS